MFSHEQWDDKVLYIEFDIRRDQKVVYFFQNSQSTKMDFKKTGCFSQSLPLEKILVLASLTEIQSSE